MPVPAFEAFIEPARRRPQIWRLIVGLILALAVYVAVMVVVLMLGVLILDIDLNGLSAPRDPTAPAPPIDFGEVIFGETPTSMMILLATFIGMALGPIVAVSLLHARRPDTLFGPRAATLRDFAIATAVAGGIILAVGLAGSALDLGPQPLRNLETTLWLTFLPMALLGVAIQTGAEEVLFRGYILQQLAARFRSPLVWIGIPTILFGLAHYAPMQNGANTWLYVVATGIFGLAAADLTARTGNIGAAWGFHFANNCAALLLVSVQGPLSGLALYVMPFGTDDTDVLRPLLAVDIVTMLVIWGAIRVAVTPRRTAAT